MMVRVTELASKASHAVSESRKFFLPTAPTAPVAAAPQGLITSLRNAEKQRRLFSTVVPPTQSVPITAAEPPVILNPTTKAKTAVKKISPVRPSPLSAVFTASELCRDAVFFFTDGSCSGNAHVAQNRCPAGWGVLPVRIRNEAEPQIASRTAGQISLPLQHELLSALLTREHCDALPGLYGPVVLNEQSPLSRFALGAQLGSNNTAELSAIAEALLHFRDHLSSHSPALRHCVILYDSEYAAKSITGEFNGKKNFELIARIREIYSETQRELRARHGNHSGVLFVKVKAHSGHDFNDIADELAKQGAVESMPARVGRYASLMS